VKKTFTPPFTAVVPTEPYHTVREPTHNLRRRRRRLASSAAAAAAAANGKHRVLSMSRTAVIRRTHAHTYARTQQQNRSGLIDYFRPVTTV